MLDFIDYITSKLSKVMKCVDYSWDSVLGIMGIMILFSIFMTSLYTVIAYIVMERSILYVSIPSFFVALSCIPLYNYQWKRYKTMMIIQHKVRVKSPTIHKIFFLGSLDPLVLKIKGFGIFLISSFFILYFFILLILLLIFGDFETSDINTQTARNAPPQARNLEADSRAVTHSYVIPFLLSFLLIIYWINKIIISLTFWSIVLFILFVLFCFYSIVYVIYRKEIKQRAEELRQRAIQNRYAADSDNNSDIGRDEESKDSSPSSDSISSASESSNIIRQVIRSMKKTFSMKKSKKKEGLGCSICYENFKDKETIIQLKCNSMHIFHEPCFHSWARRNDTCPLCRQSIVPQSEIA
ncbi:unnamed protein product [Moneuplotes crassus]|uniref:RING-type domain-containing protein n=1 Tax=Euplotes crassus TaxID=5936 RepID=A0AAD1XJ08_EUPCR|nr:unnamed protein product [Moneuplotes crassus]